MTAGRVAGAMSAPLATADAGGASGGCAAADEMRLSRPPTLREHAWRTRMPPWAAARTHCSWESWSGRPAPCVSARAPQGHPRTLVASRPPLLAHHHRTQGLLHHIAQLPLTDQSTSHASGSGPSGGAVAGGLEIEARARSPEDSRPPQPHGRSCGTRPGRAQRTQRAGRPRHSSACVGRADGQHSCRRSAAV
jgi:hypothetical protein